MPRRLLAGNDLILPPSAESLDFSFLPRLSLWRNVLFSRALKTAVKGGGGVSSRGGDGGGGRRADRVAAGIFAFSGVGGIVVGGSFSTPAGREMAVEEPTAGIEASL